MVQKKTYLVNNKSLNKSLIKIAKTCDQLGHNIIRTQRIMGMIGPAGIAD